MARKNTNVYKLLSGQSLSATFTSNPTFIQYLDNISYQINVTTTDSTGTFIVQGSLDYALNETTNVVTNPGNWVDLTLSGTPTVAAANDQILIDLNQLPFIAVRLKYTAGTAGTGTCDAYIATKQLGG